jgi:PAS domain S-box-containing protein
MASSTAHREKTHADKPKSSGLATASACCKILIVEDEILIAMDLQGRLENLGYEVPGIADTADLAFELAACHEPDLILMDIRLQGGTDGIEAAMAVRRRLDIPVIFLTSHADSETLERAKLSEPFGYIVKPFGSCNFRAVIEIALHNHKTESGLRDSLRWHGAQEKTRLLRLFRDYNSADEDDDIRETEPVPKGRLAYEEALLEAIPDAAILANHDGNILLVNGRAARLFGYQRRELQGMSVQTLFPESHHPLGDWTATEAETAGVAEEEERTAGKDRDCCCMHRSGREFPVALSLSSIPTDDGPRVLALLRDLSERKPPAEDRHRLAEIVDSTQSAIFSQTKEGIILSWNRGAERLYGYSPQEIIGYPASVLLPSAMMEQNAPSGDTVTGKDWVQEEVVQRTKDGRLIDVSQVVSLFRDAAGNVIGKSTVAMDMSEHVRGEAKLRSLLEASPDAGIVVDKDG